jgi:hypothetical protein
VGPRRGGKLLLDDVASTILLWPSLPLWLLRPRPRSGIQSIDAAELLNLLHTGSRRGTINVHTRTSIGIGVGVSVSVFTPPLTDDKQRTSGMHCNTHAHFFVIIQLCVLIVFFTTTFVMCQYLCSQPREFEQIVMLYMMCELQ